MSEGREPEGPHPSAAASAHSSMQLAEERLATSQTPGVVRKQDPRRKWQTARPLSSVTYLPEDAGPASSSRCSPSSPCGSGTRRDAQRTTTPASSMTPPALEEWMDGLRKELGALMASPAQKTADALGVPEVMEPATGMPEVYVMMEGDEEGGSDEGGEDYDAALQAFASEASDLIRCKRTPPGTAACKVVNLIDFGERGSSAETASTCSSGIEAQESIQTMSVGAGPAAERDLRDREVQYLQQRLADAYAEMEIRLATSREEVDAKERGAAQLSVLLAQAEAKSAELRGQRDSALVEAGRWRQEAARLKVQNEDLRQAARVALRSLCSKSVSVAAAAQGGG